MKSKEIPNKKNSYVNNTLKVNWENEITEQDDIELLNIIVNWTEAHDGVLPNINSTDKEEIGYATVLKEIQDKYKEYLDSDFEDLEEKQIEEIQEILNLGSLIDLWQIELPDIIAKNGESKGRSFAGKDVGPFEIIGLLRDFTNLENDIDELNNKKVINEIFEFLKQNGRMPIRYCKRISEMTEEQRMEKNLYARWERTEEYKIFQKYRGISLSDIPDKYKELIKKFRDFGLGGEEKTTIEEIIEFVEKNQILNLIMCKILFQKIN